MKERNVVILVEIPGYGLMPDLKPGNIATIKDSENTHYITYDNGWERIISDEQFKEMNGN